MFSSPPLHSTSILFREIHPLNLQIREYYLDFVQTNSDFAESKLKDQEIPIKKELLQQGSPVQLCTVGDFQINQKHSTKISLTTRTHIERLSPPSFLESCHIETIFDICSTVPGDQSLRWVCFTKKQWLIIQHHCLLTDTVVLKMIQMLVSSLFSRHQISEKSLPALASIKCRQLLKMSGSC